MVDLPQALGISFRKFFKSYKAFFKKWHSKVKNAKKDTDVIDSTSDAVDNRPSKDHEEVKKEGPRPIRGVQSFRYGGRSMRENDPTSLRPRSYDSGFSYLSRNASRRGQNPSSTSQFRSMSRRSSGPVASRVSSGRRSIDSMPIMFSNSSGVLKAATIEKQLECTLEELCFGCLKKIKVTRDILSITGQPIEEEETLTIKVKPGWRKGTKITFEGTGNKRLDSYLGDMSFVIAEKQHAYFKREGDDLELTVAIPLLKALTGCTISVPLLGGETMILETNNVVWPGYEKLIKGQGMPKPKHEDKRGNLKVKFLVEFPTKLTEQQRSDLFQILRASEYPS
ncbi:DnaJ-like subfamily B member 13 [Cucurbita argyrosperma subsp. argyrosperma]|nr:DnaJ-like subfamily B member 13 [Cucurbita argyrosperma subsp. argyrosperma]